MGRRPGRRRVGTPKGATDVICGKRCCSGRRRQRAVRRFDKLSRAPAQSQQRLLREILGTNADTEFGRRHGFGAIATFRDFQERVPISSYEDLEPYITAEMNGRPNQLTRHPPVLFTTTSGTTGASQVHPDDPSRASAPSRA